MNDLPMEDTMITEREFLKYAVWTEDDKQATAVLALAREVGRLADAVYAAGARNSTMETGALELVAKEVREGLRKLR